MADRVRIIGADGKPATRILKNDPIRIEVLRDGASAPYFPPDPAEVVFGQAGGFTTDAMQVAWDGSSEGTTTRFVTDPLTIEGGGRGGGRINIGGFEWSRGDFSGLSTGVENEVSVSMPDGGIASVQVFASNAYRSHSILTEQADLLEGTTRLAATNLRQVLDTINQIQDDNPPGLDTEKLARTKQMVEDRLAEAEKWLCLSKQAHAYLTNDELAVPQQNAAAKYMLEGAHGQSNDPGAVDLAGVQARIDQAKWETWEGPLLGGLSELAINGYRGLTNATGAAQLMTLFGSTDEMGHKVTWDKRVIAFLDLVSQATLMGANMKFQLDNIVKSTSPARAWGPGNRPKYDGAEPTKAPSGMAVDPGDMGMTPDAVRAAHITARKFDKVIEVRPTGPVAKHWREEGCLPKPEKLKSKTVNEIDQYIGADPMAPPGRVGLFDPKPDFIAAELRNGGMSEGAIDHALAGLRKAAENGVKPGDLPIPELPEGSSVPRDLWRKVGERYAQRAEEWRGPTGDKARHMAEDGEIRIEDGLIVDGPTGKHITGDHDLWDIKNRDGSPISELERKQIVGELADNEFGAQHAAHTWWDPQPEAFSDPELFKTHRGIYEKIIEGHQSNLDVGGNQRGEILISFSPEGPPTAVYSGEQLAGYVGGHPTGYRPITPGSPLTMPTALTFWTAGALSATQSIEADQGLFDWATVDLLIRQEVDVPCSLCVDAPTAIALPSATSTPWKRILAGVAGALALLVGGVLAFGGDDDKSATAVPVVVPVTDSPLVAIGDDPVTETLLPPPEIALPGFATKFALAGACAVVTHSPPPAFPGSFSFFVDHLLIAPIDGEIEPGSQLTVDAPLSDAGHYVAPVGPHGDVSILVPISSMTSYDFFSPMVETPSGSFPLIGPYPSVDVGPVEGPVGGCTPPPTMTSQERQALVDQAITDNGGAPTGGGNVGVIPGEAFPPPEDDLGPYREFLTRFGNAHAAGDVDTLYDLLHSTSIGRYGETQCRDYLAGVVGSISDLRLIDGRSEPWDYPTDDRTTDVPDAVTLELELRQQGGPPLATQMHVAVEDGELHWFTDCGEPAG